VVAHALVHGVTPCPERGSMLELSMMLQCLHILYFLNHHTRAPKLVISQYYLIDMSKVRGLNHSMSSSVIDLDTRGKVDLISLKRRFVVSFSRTADVDMENKTPCVMAGQRVGGQTALGAGAYRLCARRVVLLEEAAGRIAVCDCGGFNGVSRYWKTGMRF